MQLSQPQQPRQIEGPSAGLSRCSFQRLVPTSIWQVGRHKAFGNVYLANSSFQKVIDVPMPSLGIPSESESAARDDPMEASAWSSIGGVAEGRFPVPLLVAYRWDPRISFGGLPLQTKALRANVIASQFVKHRGKRHAALPRLLSEKIARLSGNSDRDRFCRHTTMLELRCSRDAREESV